MHSTFKLYCVVVTCLVIFQCVLWKLVAPNESLLIKARRVLLGNISQSGDLPSKSVDIQASWCKRNLDAGPIPVLTNNITLFKKAKQYTDKVTIGGKWRPTSCLPKSRVAVIVPYRDRLRELTLFLYHMHPFLQRQQLDYTIFLAEQSQSHPFNKGAVTNAAFHEAVTRGSYDCFIFHDVDVLPEDDRIVYECTDNPRHLAAAISSWNYTLIYTALFGGAIAFTRHQYQTVNGFSNAYFGWGGEDDDLGARVRHHGYKVIRYPMSIARFKKLDHERPAKGERRLFYYYGQKKRYLLDGLNSLKYELISFKEEPLFTHLVINLDKDAIWRHADSLMTTTPKATPLVMNNGRSPGVKKNVITKQDKSSETPATTPKEKSTGEHQQPHLKKSQPVASSTPATTPKEKSTGG